MSLHLYFVLVSVWLCLFRLYLIRFVCLLCQCLFVGNVPLCFMQKSLRPFSTNSGVLGREARAAEHHG